ncbi:MAG: beta-ketoacyl-[acyl-carrier-protein] synthase family protein, partial [Chitinivibrionales bacterium]|nr:beta-ketoacyl-[acyl-carrier-protein] synthase family protein [Chitinivibrionales bacterium]
VRPIQSFDTSDFRTKVGGEVRDFVAENHLEADRLPALGKSSQYAIAAGKMAIADAGIEMTKLDPWRLAVSMGTTMGEPQILEQGINIKYESSGIDEIPAGLPRQYPCGVIPANVADYFGAKGPATMVPTACAAGNYAIGYAGDLIRLGKADCVIAGGSDPFSRIAFTGFNRLLATAAERCAPFSLNRDGMAVAEGAGVLIIEELEHARARGADIYAELLGYGLGCDAFNMTIPAPDGCGGILALKRALANAQVNPADIDYVCAHGTGTKENDKVETLILKEVFGDRARSVPMSSMKSMIGHTMGAASAIEGVASVLMLHHQTLLPTINYDEADPECDLDYVPNEPREAELNVVASNAYAFGGNTSSIVLRRFTG